MTQLIRPSALDSLPPVFHIYNRANDRQVLFRTDRNYRYFLGKSIKCLSEGAHLLGYCLMPNHFHFLISPKHELKVELYYDDRIMKRLPTDEISEGVRRMLMGFSQGYNLELGITGSRWQQKTRCKHHYLSFRYGLDYVHLNPVKAKLVDHPGEWPYSSYLEYAGYIEPRDAVCNLALGRKLLAAWGEGGF